MSMTTKEIATIAARTLHTFEVLRGAFNSGSVRGLLLAESVDDLHRLISALGFDADALNPTDYSADPFFAARAERAELVAWQAGKPIEVQP